MLQKAARESLGIDLNNQVVIIDEAHSRKTVALTCATGLIILLDLIASLLSLSAAHLPLNTLTTSLKQLTIYVQKFRNRLSTEHLLHLKRLLNLMEELQQYAEGWRTSHSTTHQTQAKSPQDHPTEVMTSGELLRRLGRKVEGINLLEVEKYLRSSKVGRPMDRPYVAH